MKFRTEISPEQSASKLSYDDKLMSLGSCFAQNIGGRLKSLKFDIDDNPFGILYNPLSIAKGLEILKNDEYAVKLTQANDLWHSWHHHGDFSDPDKKKATEQIEKGIKLSAAHLKETTCLLITFGTAYYYRLKATGEVVANCHKFPVDYFERELLEVEEIIGAIDNALTPLFTNKPDLKVVFTVSPVRHWKDGAVNNQSSKARLILACEKLSAQYANAFYFPAYEILMDDLRDYRFYADDLLHPSAKAVDYIWNKFQETFFDGKTKGQAERVHKLVQAANHRALHPKTAQHQEFINTQLKALDKAEQELGLDFSTERQLLVASKASE